MYCQNCGNQLRQGATFCSACGTPVAGGQGPQRKSSDERKELLARQIANHVPRGWRVESQSDYQAVFISGRPVNHVLHLILTVITCSLWGVVWVSLVFLGGEKREIANVDEWGNVTVSRIGGNTGKVIAAIAASVFLLLVIATIISVTDGVVDSNQPAQPIDAPAVDFPTPEPIVAVNAQQVLEDYQTNETAANFNWKGKRLLVTLDGIDEIEDGGRVIKYLGDFGFDHIQMDFSDVRDVIDLVPGATVTANCRLEGFQMDSWLEFDDCSIE